MELPSVQSPSVRSGIKMWLGTLVCSFCPFLLSKSSYLFINQLKMSVFYGRPPENAPEDKDYHTMDYSDSQQSQWGGNSILTAIEVKRRSRKLWQVVIVNAPGALKGELWNGVYWILLTWRNCVGPWISVYYLLSTHNLRGSLWPSDALVPPPFA